MLLAGCNKDASVEGKVKDARARNDGPAIWKVTDHNSTMYLYGAVHLLPDGLDWQRRDLEAAFDEVGTVFFELPDDDKTALEASILQRQYGIYESGERLSDHLDPTNLNRFTAAAYNVDLPPETMELFKPWLVADMLSIAAVQKAGLKAENAVDSVLRQKALTSRKSIKALEGMKSYIEAVALQPEWVQIQTLEQTITSFDTIVSDAQKVNKQWLVGNTDMLEKDLIAAFKNDAPRMYDALFTQRNEKWSQVLDTFLQGDSNALVVVGIGHLLGPDSLNAKLIEQGYEVKRVRRFDLPN
jgi:uncharacterized protein YbaP (TraB family)